jgi:hypothetical protein
VVQVVDICSNYHNPSAHFPINKKTANMAQIVAEASTPTTVTIAEGEDMILNISDLEKAGSKKLSNMNRGT